MAWVVSDRDNWINLTKESKAYEIMDEDKMDSSFLRWCDILTD